VSKVETAREELRGLLGKLAAGESVPVNAIVPVVEAAELPDAEGLPKTSPKDAYVAAVRERLALAIAPATLDDKGTTPPADVAVAGKPDHGTPPSSGNVPEDLAAAVKAAIADGMRGIATEIRHLGERVSAVEARSSGHSTPPGAAPVTTPAPKPAPAPPPAPLSDTPGNAFQRAHGTATVARSNQGGGPPPGALTATQRAQQAATTFGTSPTATQSKTVATGPEGARSAVPAAAPAVVATPTGPRTTEAATVIDVQSAPAGVSVEEQLAKAIGGVVEAFRPIAARAARELPADHPGRVRVLAFLGEVAREAASVSEALTAGQRATQPQA
jgi:hypothetical protein